MKYQNFIQAIKHHETAKVTALNFPRSSAMGRIPSVVEELVPGIMRILADNSSRFCQAGEILAVFGLQYGPNFLQSGKPLRLNRVFSQEAPRNHLCLVMQFLVTTPQAIGDLTSWVGSQNIVIDFTTGELMDGERYFHLLNGDTNPKGILYGTLPAQALENVWRQIHPVNFASLTGEEDEPFTDVTPSMRMVR